MISHWKTPTNIDTLLFVFSAFFQDLLVRAKADFHQLFLRTYGIMYRQNSEVALKLFDDLLSYYSTGTPDLNAVLDGFFIRLYETMFKVGIICLLLCDFKGESITPEVGGTSEIYGSIRSKRVVARMSIIIVLALAVMKWRSTSFHQDEGLLC